MKRTGGRRKETHRLPGFQEVPVILYEVRDAIVATAASSLSGLHVTGSLVSGEFDPRISDLDLIATLTVDPTPALMSRLSTMHSGLVREHPDWSDRIEVVYVAENRLREIPAPIPTMGVISPGEPLHLVSAGPDWILTWYPAREDSVPLLGGPLSDILPPISAEEFLEEARARMVTFDGAVTDNSTRGTCAYTIMTVCRGLYFVRLGRRASKAQACEWVAIQHPEWASLLASAARWRQDQWSENPTDPDAISATRRFVGAMLRELDCG